ncbi:MAG: GIY-YIG nuclease family protein [Thermosynechococcus sp. Uc]|uniref:GIY-YIG nuclease family protein n=1 Tax=Thermosynechococcus sp. Uc TaxID=3034853 RepID=UPI00259F1A5E|nr:GIY-YIG nuclease family protein [Thermosynechococcus sp. Uc]MDM7327000.1 GIY-YIG nuclease family protein [Thermosynechococcus sp. Uc]
MTPPAPTLAQLPLPFYTDGSGPVAPDRKGAIALDAIFDATGNAQYIGYFRNVRLSLLQHFVHFPHQCDGYKAIALERPDRPWLEMVKQRWIAELGVVPLGNDCDRPQWENAIDLKKQMTAAERPAWANADPPTPSELLKQAAQRVKAAILEQLRQRSLQEPLLFGTKLKESGRLDLK